MVHPKARNLYRTNQSRITFLRKTCIGLGGHAIKSLPEMSGQVPDEGQHQEEISSGKRVLDEEHHQEEVSSRPSAKAYIFQKKN